MLLGQSNPSGGFGYPFLLLESLEGRMYYPFTVSFKKGFHEIAGAVLPSIGREQATTRPG